MECKLKVLRMWQHEASVEQSCYGQFAAWVLWFHTWLVLEEKNLTSCWWFAVFTGDKQKKPGMIWFSGQEMKQACSSNSHLKCTCGKCLTFCILLIIYFRGLDLLIDLIYTLQQMSDYISSRLQVEFRWQNQSVSVLINFYDFRKYFYSSSLIQ